MKWPWTRQRNCFDGYSVFWTVRSERGRAYPLNAYDFLQHLQLSRDHGNSVFP